MGKIVARRVFLVGLVLATALTDPVFGDAAARGARAGFHVHVQVVGSARAASVPMSAASAASPSGASRARQLSLDVATRAGYFVRFEIEDPAIQRLEVEGLGPDVRIDSGAKDVFVRSSPAGRVVTYRVKVRPGAQLSVAPPVRATISP